MKLPLRGIVTEIVAPDHSALRHGQWPAKYQQSKLVVLRAGTVAFLSL